MGALSESTNVSLDNPGDAAADAGRSVSKSGSQEQGHVLEEISSILVELNRESEASQAEAELLSQARSDFLDTFKRMCLDVARPAMQAVADQLKAAGGDGLVEEFPGGQARVSTPRLTLWMSLKGTISGAPRPDRHPYLQLDADVEHHTVRLSEGDMWQGGGGGHSGSAGTWNVEEITPGIVLDETLGIIRRAAQLSPKT
ncbi:MAG: hypothetical protein ACP5P1_07650 [Acidimicrobiales bacterium]